MQTLEGAVMHDGYVVAVHEELGEPGQVYEDVAVDLRDVVLT